MGKNKKEREKRKKRKWEKKKLRKRRRRIEGKADGNLNMRFLLEGKRNTTGPESVDASSRDGSTTIAPAPASIFHTGLSSAFQI